MTLPPDAVRADARLDFAATVDLVFRHYGPAIQFSAHQVLTIAQAIRSRASGASLLVFGCGNDSALWAEINRDGRTVFLENHPDWLQRVKGQWPSLDIHQVSYEGWTVETSLPVDPERLRAAAPPPVLAATRWDVVVVDSPMGFRPGQPGRALPIYWSSLLASPDTDVFIDDANRVLERTYAERFFGDRRHIRVPRLTKGTKPSREFMIWALGRAPGQDDGV